MYHGHQHKGDHNTAQGLTKDKNKATICNSSKEHAN